jgi:hypothetical protein
MLRTAAAISFPIWYGLGYYLVLRLFFRLGAL